MSETASDEQGPSKKARFFVAKQACEHCRVKKTRCDEEFPCGHCQSLGVECRYSERRPTRKEESLGAMFHCLRRIETQLSKLSSEVNDKVPSLTALPTPQAAEVPWLNSIQPTIIPTTPLPPIWQQAPKSPRRPQPISVKGPISFSGRLTWSWPSLASRLPPEAIMILQDGPSNYAVTVETTRKPLLPREHHPSMARKDGSPSDLSVSLVKELSSVYFATFNLANPILDREFFSRQTLPTAITTGFEYNIESCVVLLTMALGAWGQRALAEAGLDSRQPHQVTSPVPEWISTPEIPGFGLFMEARKRMTFLLGHKSLQSCQCHLLASLIYLQLVRPVDALDSVLQAATCSSVFWKSKTDNGDPWTADMQSRLYWIATTLESLLIDELTIVQPSRLDELQEFVPLPEFLKFESYSVHSNHEPSEDNFLCHYHFLSQITHRILINRIKDTLFNSGSTSSYSSISLEDEMTYQLEQWREHLPSTIAFEDPSDLPPPQSPLELFVTPWLPARYVVAKWHIGRPFLHRILTQQQEPSEIELSRCKEILSCLTAWVSILRVIKVTKSCLPVIFNLCAHLFSQVLLLYCFRTDPMYLGVLPPDHESLWSVALEILEDCAPLSPTVSRDARVVRILYQKLTS